QTYPRALDDALPIFSREIYETRSWEYVRLLGRVLETLQRSPDGSVAWIVLSQEMIRAEGARQDESEGFIQYPRMVDGVEVALFLDRKSTRLNSSHVI